MRRPAILPAAPNNFVHPVNVVRDYLKVNVVTDSSVSVGRVNAVGGVPVSDYVPNIVQPVQGAGPRWMGRDTK